ncbi:hypothetical protein R1flu_019608 [Riccia fluitans]|uniref:Uncharacterized protein n=1 Tax=Riccia fluitans TaxID=41844 RepID=A0ABD1ZJ53_9MARC
MKEPKKRKARKQSVSNSATEKEEEEKAKDESPNATWIGEASRSKLHDMTMAVTFKKWGIVLHNLGRETSKLFEDFLVNINELSPKEVAHNLERISTPPPAVEAVDL